MRDRTLENYQGFWSLVWEKWEEYENRQELRFILDVILAGELKLGFPNLVDLPKNIMDIAMAFAANTINHWTRFTEESLEIVHDNSSGMAKNKLIWDRIVEMKCDKVTVGYDRRTWALPFNVTQQFLQIHRICCKFSSAIFLLVACVGGRDRNGTAKKPNIQKNWKRLGLDH